MGQCVMVIGKSGSGKSTSLRNFKKGEVGVLNIAGKKLPFRNDLGTLDNATYDECYEALKTNKLNTYIIDDSTYLMQFENFYRAYDKGFDKFTQMAVSFEKLLSIARHTNDDTIVYFLHHPNFSDDGSSKPQTIGKMLDNQLNMEGLFPIVIECRVDADGKHKFITKNDGHNIAKAPIDMLPDEMDNDLAAVDKLIREYWGMSPLMKEAGNAK